MAKIMDIKDLEKAIKESRKEDKFKDHFMAEKENEAKELYFTALIKTAENIGLSDKKNEFLSKIFNSFGLSDYDKYSKIENDDFLMNLAKNFKNTKNVDYLLIDILILANLDKDFNKNNSKLVAKVFDLFEITENKFIGIMEVSKYILTLSVDRKDYNDYQVEMKKMIVSETINVDKNITYKDDKIFISCKFDFNNKAVMNFSAQNYKFIACEMKSPLIDFSNTDNIEIIRCDIEGKSELNTSLYGENSGNICIKRSCFRDISNNNLILFSFYRGNNSNIKVDECKFDNCSSHYSESSNSYLFYFTSINNIHIKGNKLNNCSSSSFYNAYGAYFFYLDNCGSGKIENTIFRDCKYKTKDIYLYSSNRVRVIGTKVE